MPTILLRRGTTVERDEYTPLQGEIIFDTTDNRVYTGDGETKGGVPVGSALLKTTVKRTAMTPLAGQLVLDTDTNVLYVGNGSTTGGVAVGNHDLTQFNTNNDTIGSTATHTITNSYTEIITGDETSESDTNDTPAVTLTGGTGTIVYVYFKTAGTRTGAGGGTRNITVQGVSMVQGNFKTFFKTTDGWKEI